VDSILVRIAEEAVTDKVGTAMGDKAVAFHFSHAEASVSGASLQGLASEHCYGSTCSRVDLVVNLSGGIEVVLASSATETCS
jgi:hypothetical protein